MPNLHNLYKSAERKIPQKNSDHMLNYSLQLKFGLIFFYNKAAMTIEEISIFSNSSHLEWRAELLDIIVKGDHPRTIPAGFGLT